MEVDDMEDTLVQLVCLPLYSESNTQGRYVPERNSLNMWNASGRERHEDEVGIPIPIEFRNKYPDFFPGVGRSFELILPNYITLSAKQCQQDGKALMSNPNKDLGKWLLRTILGIPKLKVVTYSMLRSVGIDSVYIEKWSHGRSFYYKMFPAPTNEYDRFIRGAKIQRSGPVKAEIISSPQQQQKSATNQKPQRVASLGEAVTHKVFGIGTIVSINGDTVEVQFPNSIKKLQYTWLVNNKCV